MTIFSSKKSPFSVLLILLLTGCFTKDQPPTALSATEIPNYVAAVLRDIKPISGVSYICPNTRDRGITSERGEFYVIQGAQCTFYLNGYELGQANHSITESYNQLTAYEIENSHNLVHFATREYSIELFVANMSAMFQSLNAHSNENNLDLSLVEGSSLIDLNPLRSPDNQSFVTAMSQVEIKQSNGTVQPLEKLKNFAIVKPMQAKDLLDNTFTSSEVQQIINNLEFILTGDKITTINIQKLLAEYRAKLETADGSNGYHQNALLAMLEIAEILNMPAVADRINIITENDYSSMLAQALDLLISPLSIIELIDTPQGTTNDISILLTEMAFRLVQASEKLGLAMPGESYFLPYFDNDEITYQDTLAIRTAALVVANMLYTLSSYQMGDDSYYLPRQQQLSQITTITEVATWTEKTTAIEIETSSIDIDVEYSLAVADPLQLQKSRRLMRFREQAKQLLPAAKTALIDAVTLAKQINFSDYLSKQKTNRMVKLIASLDAHLKDKFSVLNYPYKNKQYFLNLHRFYSMQHGIDRTDFAVTASYYQCAENLKNAKYSAELSMIFAKPICSHQDDYLITTADGGSQIVNTRIKSISYADGDNWQSWTFIPAIDAKPIITLTETARSDAKQVIWCGEDLQQNKLSCF